jgi:DUF1365 family protein
VSLDQAVRNLVERETGVRPCGSIRLLTRLRSLGEGFNPVSFYYCYDACGERIETILAEITNTPWNERHTYVLSARDSRSDGKHLCFSFDKRFHVSPFMPMDIDYDWRFSRPDERIVVHMENRRRSELLFDATLTLTRNEINGKNLAIALAIHQWTRLLVLAAIHWQALRLWCKRVPYFTHPGKRAEEKAR